MNPSLPQFDHIDELFGDLPPIEVPTLELEGFTVEIDVLLDSPASFTDLPTASPPRMPTLHPEN